MSRTSGVAHCCVVGDLPPDGRYYFLSYCYGVLGDAAAAAAAASWGQDNAAAAYGGGGRTMLLLLMGGRTMLLLMGGRGRTRRN